MKALVLYVVFVVVGALLATAIGWWVETYVSEAVSLVVFLVLFFSNFVVSWILVILAMDGTLKNAHARAEQLAVEAESRRAR